MLGFKVSWLRTSLLTLAGLLLASGVAWAHGGGGGGHGGGGHGGGGHAGGVGGFGHGVGVGGFGRGVGVGVGGFGRGVGVGAFGFGGLGRGGVAFNRSASTFYSPGFYRGLGYSPYFGRGYPYGFGYGLGLGYGLGSGWGFGGFGLGYPFNGFYNYGNGLGLPYNAYNTGWGGAYPYSYYGYGSTPYNAYSSLYPAIPSDYGITGSQSQGSSPPKDDMAHLLVIVPENAELWFNGTKTTQTGPQREFVSPELTPAKHYSYEIKARWKENGKDVEQVRTAHVQANDWNTIDFTKPEPSSQEKK